MIYHAKAECMLRISYPIIRITPEASSGEGVRSTTTFPTSIEDLNRALKMVGARTCIDQCLTNPPSFNSDNKGVPKLARVVFPVYHKLSFEDSNVESGIGTAVFTQESCV